MSSSFPSKILALLALLAAGCASQGSPESSPPQDGIRIAARPDRPNVVLIVNDTMRRDPVGIYGGTARTPVFDGFAAENFYFDRAFANAPWTKPSMATLFTSLYPSQHGLASHPDLRRRVSLDDVQLGEIDVLGDGFVTLAEVLRDAGYRTAAFVSNPWMVEDFGFEQGFDVYDDAFARWNAPGEELSRKALQWIDGLDPEDQFFLYIHYVDSHQPYGRLTDSDILDNLGRLEKDARTPLPTAGSFYDWLVTHPQQQLSDDTIDRLKKIGPTRAFMELVYDRGIEDFDRALGTFLEGFSGHASFDRTAIIVTSDHGEALYDREYGGHGTGLFDDEAAIPMAVRLPGAVARDPLVRRPVGLIDLMPSLCTYLGTVCPVPTFGKSFVGVGGEPPEDADSIVTEGVMFKSRNRTLRDRPYKLFWEPDGPRMAGAGEYSLFDVVQDPGETRDLLSEEHRTPESERIRSVLARQLHDRVPPFDRPEQEFSEVDAELEERLRALGYLQ